MYTVVKGTFENGQIILEEPAPTAEKTNVVVMFLAEEIIEGESNKNGVRQMASLKKLGELQGRTFNIPDDFNDPLDDLKDYI